MNEKFYNNLVTLLNLFKNRPYHLAKYLVDNSGLDMDFVEKIENSDKLSELFDKEDILRNFNSISDMEKFYDSLLSEVSNKNNMERDLNEKLDNFIKLEKYEDAARLRDYMTKNDIKRNNL